MLWGWTELAETTNADDGDDGDGGDGAGERSRGAPGNRCHGERRRHYRRPPNGEYAILRDIRPGGSNPDFHTNAGLQRASSGPAVWYWTRPPPDLVVFRPSVRLAGIRQLPLMPFR